ncbi:cation:proton antiporter [Candidatus Micrarchaeota archaeon]|nr:cation:proton antiporter [Candidatus Micrarchaeota archaeon]
MSEMLELGIIFFSLLAGLILTMRLKLPPVIGILIAGVVIGPNVLGFVKGGDVVNIFSEIGAVLLLFIIGIEFSLSKIMKFGMRALLLAFFKLAFVFVLMYELSLVFGLTPFQGLLIATLFSFSSTTFFSKLIKDRDVSCGEEVNLLFAVLILEDILAVFALAVLSATPASAQAELVFSEFTLSIVKSLTMLIICYIILQEIVKILFEYFANFKTVELLLFASLSVCALFVFLATFFGFDASIGAFLAGSLMASLRQFKSIEKTMLPFGLFFSSFFFLSMGMVVNPASLYSNFPLILALFAVNVIAKFLSTGIGTHLLGSNLRASVFSGISMLTVGEFSLLIARKAQGVAGFDILGAVSVAVFLSALLSGLLMKQIAPINAWVVSSTPAGMRSNGRRFSRYIDAVLAEFEPKGNVFRLFTKERRTIIWYGILLLLINGVLFLGWQALEAAGIVSSADASMVLARIALHAILSAGVLAKMLGSFDRILNGVVDTFRNVHGATPQLDRRLTYDGVTVLLLLELAVVLPFAFSFLMLPSFFGYLAAVPLAFAAVFSWDLVSTACRVLASRRKRSAYLEYRMRKTSIFDVLGRARAADTLFKSF